MRTPIDEEKVGIVMREMLSSRVRQTPPVAPSELRSRASHRALRRVDRKALAVAAVAAVIVTLIAVGPSRSVIVRRTPL